jgi:hypothetical protein
VLTVSIIAAMDTNEDIFEHLLSNYEMGRLFGRCSVVLYKLTDVSEVLTVSIIAAMDTNEDIFKQFLSNYEMGRLSL